MSFGVTVLHSTKFRCSVVASTATQWRLQASRTIEAVYDAILMERHDAKKVKLRCQKASGSQSAFPIASQRKSSSRKSRLHINLRWYAKSTDILLPGSLFLGLSVLLLHGTVSQTLQLALVVGVGLSLYFLNRKEQSLVEQYCWLS